MIRKLKAKFAFLAAASLLVLLSLIVVGMNVVNYNSVVSDADETLSFLSSDKGDVPKFDGTQPMLPHGMSPEVPYESRFFTVYLDSGNGIVDAEMSKIASVSQAEAEDFTAEALKKSSDKGFTGKFRFLKTEDKSGYKITFLDCGRKIDAFNTFLTASIIISVLGYVIVTVVIFILSGRIIKPFAENYEKQKRFIADAGHDIKTPLTVIAANADLLGMEIGKNECLDDIKEQTKHMRTLIDELISLAKAEESERALVKIDFPVSDVTNEVAHGFRSPALLCGKKFTCDVQPDLTLCGNDRAYRQLVEILLDNAFKYSPRGAYINLSLSAKGRALHLTVKNETENAVEKEQLERLFDRFYRTDFSRSSETGGYGIGLSLAKSAVAAHGGRIQAFYDTPNIFRIEAVLPI